MVNPAIASGSSVSLKIPITKSYIYPGGARISWIQKRLFSHYSSCKLNQKHSGVIGYGCDKMWCFVTDNDSLLGAHSAIVDARAQSTVMADKRFLEYIDKPVSMILMADVWAAK